MFCFPVGLVIDELREHAPEVLKAVTNTLAQSRKSEGKGFQSLALDPDQFANVPEISIDYALMERSSKVAVVPCDIGCIAA